MGNLSFKQWILFSTLSVFLLTFFVFYSDTYELFSSLTAAILSAILVGGSIIIISWIARAFMK